MIDKYGVAINPNNKGDNKSPNKQPFYIKSTNRLYLNDPKFDKYVYYTEKLIQDNTGEKVLAVLFSEMEFSTGLKEIKKDDYNRKFIVPALNKNKLNQKQFDKFDAPLELIDSTSWYDLYYISM